ncbi:hypothetical protein ENH_00024040 [Eimeria necatrix]|uniref:Uncharacterized protein n=1 Tax=Eimeria necatrix TaxID=51315 RepID=U6MW46_9EIME|nr:hypothetical protein ENH_00024040 [Eimeria necatrix]CDJ66709.1 hypothetical protein ENH_00024040 [Eimeria necatrix]
MEEAKKRKVKRGKSGVRGTGIMAKVGGVARCLYTPSRARKSGKLARKRTLFGV